MCSRMFIAVLFAIAKIWRQPKCPSVEISDKKKKYGTFTQWNTYVAIKNEGILTLGKSMGGPGDYYAK